MKANRQLKFYLCWKYYCRLCLKRTESILRSACASAPRWKLKKWIWIFVMKWSTISSFFRSFYWSNGRWSEIFTDTPWSIIRFQLLIIQMKSVQTDERKNSKIKPLTSNIAMQMKVGPFRRLWAMSYASTSTQNEPKRNRSVSFFVSCEHRIFPSERVFHSFLFVGKINGAELNQRAPSTGPTRCYNFVTRYIINLAQFVRSDCHVPTLNADATSNPFQCCEISIIRY